MAHFLVALVLVGIGWNFMYTGGTTLLTEAYAPGGEGAHAGRQRLHHVLDDGGVVVLLRRARVVGRMGDHELRRRCRSWSFAAGVVIWYARMPKAAKAVPA